MTVYTPVNRIHGKGKKNRAVSVQYTIRKLDTQLVMVCAATFRSITGIGPTRLRRIACHFNNTGTPPTEKRGGKRGSEKFVELQDSAVQFIKSFKVRESHYSRKKHTQCRQYLPSELSIASMYKMWVAKLTEKNHPVGSLSFFKKVFYTRFNIGFGLPATDICSTCKLYEKNISNGEEPEENKLKLLLHKKQGEKFHELMRESVQRSDTLSIVFDIEQNLPLPKIGLGQEYYKRQLWLYNLTFVVNEMHKDNNKKRNILLYTWAEHESNKGSNEVCSALGNCLKQLEPRIKRRKYRNLDLYCDSCPGQNKNQSMLCLLLRYINSPKNIFHRIRIIFPVRGHSYMPPDRVFGNLEKKFRKQSQFKSPENYYQHMRNAGKLFIYKKHWRVFDHKSVSNQVMKNLPKKMPIRDSKVWTFRKNAKAVQISKTYFGSGETFKMKSSNIVRFPKPRLLPSVSNVSAAKLKDVNELLKFIKLNEEEKAFYNNVTAGKRVKGRDEYPIEK